MNRRSFLTKSAQCTIAAAVWPKSELLNGSPKNMELILAEVEKLIPPLMDQHKVPGISAAIISNGKLAWNKAFGVKDARAKTPG